jgi:nucleoside-diphosphate-sugar epimerase
MRIFVTGSTGILGRHVCRFLKVYHPSAEIMHNRADITDKKSVREQISSSGTLDLVIHLAAIVPVSEVKANPAKAYEVNVGGTVNLIDAISRQKPKFVYCSSGHVYASSGEPIDEDAPSKPVSLYGRTKWIGELAAIDICDAHEIPLCIPRVFSIHDPAQTGSFLRPNIEKRLASEDLSTPFELFGALSLRDILTAEEAARRLVLVALSDAIGPVNIGSGHGTLIKEFAQSLSPSPLKIKPMGEPDMLVANICRLEKILGDALYDYQNDLGKK